MTYIVYPFQVPVKRRSKDLKTRWAVASQYDRSGWPIASFDTEEAAQALCKKIQKKFDTLRDWEYNQHTATKEQL